MDEEALRQFSTLSSLLAGFGVMVLASLLFLASTSIAAMDSVVRSDRLSYVPSELPSPEEIGFHFLDAVAVTLAASTCAGALAFSFGVALLGWIRSRLVGLISTISALLFVLIFNLIVATTGILVLSAGSSR